MIISQSQDLIQKGHQPTGQDRGYKKNKKKQRSEWVKFAPTHLSLRCPHHVLGVKRK